MGAQGTTTVDFGAFPGASDTSVAVTGQTGILAGSLVEAFLFPVATADHTADEHLVETITVRAGNIVAGTGFTIYAFNNSEINEPVIPVPQALGNSQGAKQGTQHMARGGGTGTRIYGLWTVAWVWN